MKFRDRLPLQPLALVGFTLATGLLAASFCSVTLLIGLTALCALCCGIGAALFLLRNRKNAFAVIFLLTLAAAMAIALSGRFALLKVSSHAGTIRQFSGVVEAVWRGERACYRIRAEEGELPAGTPVLIYSGTVPEYSPGETVSLLADFYTEPPGRSQMARGAQLTGVSAPELMELEKPTGGFSLLLSRLRERVRYQLYRRFSRPVAGFFAALFLGDMGELPETVENTFSLLGITHILCVSGFHIAMLTRFLLWVFRRIFGIGLQSVIPALLGAGCFVLFTGSAPSAVRALVMSAFALSAHALCRENSPANALGGAVFLLCLANPRVVFGIGFWLSVLSCAGLFAAAPRWAKTILQALPKKLRGIGPVRGAVSVLTATAAVDLFCLPVFFLDFGSIPWKAIPANLLLTPALPLLFLGGALSLLPGMGLMGDWASWITSRLFALLEKLAQGSGSLPLAQGWIPLLILISGVLLGLAFQKGRSRHKRLAMALCLVMLAAGAWSYALAGKDTLRVAFIQTNSGGSIVLSRGRAGVVVGCGGDRRIGRKTAAYLEAMGITSIELLLLPEGDGRSMGGARQLLTRFSANTLCCETENNWYQTLSDQGRAERFLPLLPGEYRVLGDALLMISQSRKQRDIGLSYGGCQVLFQSRKQKEPESGWDFIFFYDGIPEKDIVSSINCGILKMYPPAWLRGFWEAGDNFAPEAAYQILPEKD